MGELFSEGNHVRVHTPDGRIFLVLRELEHPGLPTVKIVGRERIPDLPNDLVLERPRVPLPGVTVEQIETSLQQSEG
jgi:hypothetical protein